VTTVVLDGQVGQAKMPQEILSATFPTGPRDNTNSTPKEVRAAREESAEKVAMAGRVKKAELAELALTAA
jgi:hypothetical protein